GRTEADVGLAAVDEVLHLDLHVGAALARLRVLDLHGTPNAAFIFDDVAGTDVHAADLHDRLPAKTNERAPASPKPRFGGPLAADLFSGKQRVWIDCGSVPPALSRRHRIDREVEVRARRAGIARMADAGDDLAALNLLPLGQARRV